MEVKHWMPKDYWNLLGRQVRKEVKLKKQKKLSDGDKNTRAFKDKGVHKVWHSWGQPVRFEHQRVYWPQ